MEPAYVYRATLSRVVDGDTYELDIDLGFRVHTIIPVRLHGIDVYERNTPQGIEATAFAHKLLSGRELVVQSYKDQMTFARWVGDIWVDDIPVADRLRVAGFEKPQAVA
jgi:micrococcal nuclease